MTLNAPVSHHSLPQTLDQIEFRPAGQDDILQLVDLYAAFFAGSDLPGLGLEMSAWKTQQWLQRALPERTPHLVAIDRDDGSLIGSLSYELDGRGLEQPYAYLDKFYVRRDWRLSGIGRVLLQLAVVEARAAGAVAFRAGISSGIGTGKNLFLKYGFRETTGSTLLARRL